MKQHITSDDLKSLTSSQIDKLRFLWIPKIYDLVCTKVCTDAENDTFESIEFIVGNVNVEDKEKYTFRHVYSHCLVSLQDIRSMSDSTGTEMDTDNMDEREILTELKHKTDSDEEEQPDEDDEEQSESDFETDSDELSDEIIPSRPYVFGLEECLPLLNIGNMIEILINGGKDYDSFNINFAKDEFILKKDSASFDESNADIQNSELCDVLWQAILDLL